MSWFSQRYNRVISSMTQRELAQLVSLGESSHLEFKRRVPRPQRIAKEIIALANTSGGRLLLGVNDDGRIVGVRDAEEEEFALRRALKRYCEPLVEVRSERVPVENGRDVIIVHVEESVNKPHFLVSVDPDGARTAYVRVGDKSVEASREALNLMRTRNDRQDVTFQFGEKEQMLMRYLDSYGQITVEQFASLVDVSSHSASDTLILLTRANVLQLHTDDKQDYFTLAY